MNHFAWVAALLISAPLGAFANPHLEDQSKPASQLFSLDSTRELKSIGVKAEVVTYKGRKAVRLTEDAQSHSAQTLALLNNTDFTDGTIEVDVAGSPAPGASIQARGFVGVTFRTAPEGSKFEYFYVRPTNGRADDQLRRNHSTQYASEPDYPWERLRQENPGLYESYVDLEPGEWTRLRIVAQGAKAQLYVNGALQPALVVNDLKLGQARGQVGLWIGSGTEAYFSRMKITHSGPTTNPGSSTAAPASNHALQAGAGGASESPQPLTDDDEIQLGAALARQFDQQRGIGPSVQTKQIESYLQEVADKVAAHASRKLRYQVHYDPHPGFRSAMALPGGHIVFGGGALALMKSEDELASVLGHEIIHIDERQVAERIVKIAKNRHLFVKDTSQWDVFDFGATYAREQELACDRDGARLAVQAGYSPLGMLHLLETFKFLAGAQAPGPSPQNKMIDDRIAQISDEIRTEQWESLTKQKPLALP